MCDRKPQQEDRVVLEHREQTKPWGRPGVQPTLGTSSTGTTRSGLP